MPYTLEVVEVKRWFTGNGIESRQIRLEGISTRGSGGPDNVALSFTALSKDVWEVYELGTRHTITIPDSN